MENRLLGPRELYRYVSYRNNKTDASLLAHGNRGSAVSRDIRVTVAARTDRAHFDLHVTGTRHSCRRTLRSVAASVVRWDYDARNPVVRGNVELAVAGGV